MNEENNELKLTESPAAHDRAGEMEATRGMLKLEIETLAPPAGTGIQPGKLVKGVEFDPARHKVNADGSPMLGSKSQLLLKKEAKKTARQKIHDGINSFLGKKPEQEKIENSTENPLSDHELKEKEVRENLGQVERQMEISRNDKALEKSAKRSANGILLGGSLLLGKELYRQRTSRDFDDLVSHCYEWEKETGHKVELHPNLAFPIAVIGSIYAMAQKEPECSARLDKGIDVARENILGIFGERFSFLQVFKKEEIPAREDASND